MAPGCDSDFVAALRASNVTIAALRAGRPPGKAKLWVYDAAAAAAEDVGGLRPGGFEQTLGVGAALWAGSGNPITGFRRGWGAFTDPTRCESPDVNNPNAAHTQGACMLAGLLDQYIFQRVADSKLGSYAASSLKSMMTNVKSQILAKDPAADEDMAEKVATTLAGKQLAAEVAEDGVEASVDVVAAEETGGLSLILMAVQTLGMVLDIFDPEGYAGFMTDANINETIANMLATRVSNRAVFQCQALKQVFQGDFFTELAKTDDARLCKSVQKLKKCISVRTRMYPQRTRPLQDFYSTTNDPAIRATIANYMVDYLRWTARDAAASRGYTPPAHDKTTGLPLYDQWVPRRTNSLGTLIARPQKKKGVPGTPPVETPLQRWYLRTVVGFVERRNPRLGSQMAKHANLGLGLSLAICILAVVLAAALAVLACTPLLT